MRWKKAKKLVSLFEKKESQCEGNFTIEMALLMPVILCVISVILYLGFYLYDYHRLTAVVEEGARKSALYMKYEGNMDAGEVDYARINQHLLWEVYSGDTLKQEIKLKEYLDERIGNKFFIMEHPMVQVDITFNQVTVQVRTSIQKRIPFVNFIFSDTIVVTSRKIHHPTLVLRQGEAIVQTGRKIKGVDNLMEQVEKFLNKN